MLFAQMLYSQILTAYLDLQPHKRGASTLLYHCVTQPSKLVQHKYFLKCIFWYQKYSFTSINGMVIRLGSVRIKLLGLTHILLLAFECYLASTPKPNSVNIFWNVISNDRYLSACVGLPSGLSTVRIIAAQKIPKIITTVWKWTLTNGQKGGRKLM